MVTGNGISATESRNLNGSFNSIEVSTGIDLYLTQSQTTSISVKADKNIMEFINTEIENFHERKHKTQKCHKSNGSL